jgi:hypothetical protein
MPRHPDGPTDNSSTEGSAAKPVLHAGQAACSFTESGSVAVAALLNLVRLMGAELVLNHAGGETERFEQAVRAKIGQFATPNADAQAREVGLTCAKDLVEQVIAQIRAQAKMHKSLSAVTRRNAPEQATVPAASRLPLPRLLN